MTKKNKKYWIIFLIVLVSIVAFFWVRKPHYTGARSGRVIDADTGQPIEGAIVYCMWIIRTAFWTTEYSFCGAQYETVTDKEGRYWVPNQRLRRQSLLLDRREEEICTIYKPGYAAYSAWDRENGMQGWSFLKWKTGPYQKYRPRNNLVKLDRWQDSFSREKHVEWFTTVLDNYSALRTGSRLAQEVEKEREWIKKSKRDGTQ